MTTKCVIILGPASAGKSHLCHAFGNWLKNENYQVRQVNLDAATTYIPYEPDFDIRERFTTLDIMKNEKIGPNSAILRANEKILKQSDEIITILKQYQVDFILIDTPGQLETFVFQHAGPKFLRRLQEEIDAIGLYLVDVETFETKAQASELVVNLLLFMATNLKIGINLLPVLSKSDKLSGESDLEKMLSNPLYLKETIIKNQDLGAIKEIVLPIVETTLEPIPRIIRTSVKTNDFLDLFDLIHETFCACGDLS